MAFVVVASITAGAGVAALWADLNASGVVVGARLENTTGLPVSVSITRAAFVWISEPVGQGITDRNLQKPRQFEWATADDLYVSLTPERG